MARRTADEDETTNEIVAKLENEEEDEETRPFPGGGRFSVSRARRTTREGWRVRRRAGGRVERKAEKRRVTNARDASPVERERKSTKTVSNQARRESSRRMTRLTE